MEVIVTHDVADFDALASAFAARRLHPEAHVVRRRALGPSVRRFLSVHRDHFPTIRHVDVDQAAIRRLILVDVQGESRLRDFPVLCERARRGDPSLEVEVWDHHAAGDDDLPTTVAHVSAVGAAVTLLVEALRAGGLSITPTEATLFALGIHADTGSLTYDTSTARDAAALSWLVERGASQAMLRRYLQPALADDQQALLVRVLESAKRYRYGGHDIAVAEVELPRMIDGLSVVAGEAARLSSSDALFVVFDVGGRKVQITARSGDDTIDVGAVMRILGGGGHVGAAAGIRTDASALEVVGELHAALASVSPSLRVNDVMSREVASVSPDDRLSEVAQVLDSTPCSGVPVLDGGRLVGILSRSDVERARREGRMSHPASSCMHTKVEVTTPDESLEAALTRLENAGVGRLPVLEGGAMVGIVSRSDLRQRYYAGTPDPK